MIPSQREATFLILLNLNFSVFCWPAFQLYTRQNPFNFILVNTSLEYDLKI